MIERLNHHYFQPLDLVFFRFFLTSCSKGGDSPLFKCNFSGVWEGEFIGDDSGFMSGIVTSECKVSGSTYSYALDQYDDLNATLDSTGYFSGSSTNGAVFEGQIRKIKVLINQFRADPNQAYNKEYGTEYCTLIPGNIYGKSDNFNLEYGHVIPSLIHKCHLAKLDGKQFNIWGDGSVYREFIYSEDIARIAIELIISKVKLPSCVIASGDNEVQIKEVVNLICNAFNYHQINWEKEKPMGQLRRPTSKKLLNTIFPNFIFKSLDDGIKETVNWFIKNYPHIRT